MAGSKSLQGGLQRPFGKAVKVKTLKYWRCQEHGIFVTETCGHVLILGQERDNVHCIYQNRGGGVC